MDDLSDTFNEEKSELLYGTENAVQRGVQFMQNVMKGMDLFGDKNGPSIIIFMIHFLEKRWIPEKW